MREDEMGRDKKGKTVPLEAWSGPESSRKLRFPYSMTTGTGWWKCCHP